MVFFNTTHSLYLQFFHDCSMADIRKLDDLEKLEKDFEVSSNSNFRKPADSLGYLLHSIVAPS